MKHVLEIDSVILEFGQKRVLTDVYLKCETGNITGLLGRNGTGKTCLMNIAHGMLNPVNSSVRIDGKVLLNSKSKSGDMLYLTQQNFIPRFLNLRRIFKDFNLDIGSFFHDFPEFEKYYRTSLKNLSGGERRIVEIYVIITSDCKFCLLDEPFSHVMPVHVNQIKNLIVREKEKKGMVVTDHMYQHITDICDEIYLIRDGSTHLINNLGELETLGYLRNENM